MPTLVTPKKLKFRAWDEDRKRMGYSEHKIIDYDFSFNGENNELICDRCEPDCDFVNAQHYTYHRLDNIMQYVRFNDKNNKEIYEGDIVALNSLPGFVVEYDEENARFIFNGEYKDPEYGKCGFNLYSQKEIEILGNIYENPELLNTTPR